MDETPAGVRLQRFPVGPARARLYRWLARRRIVAGIAWYVGIVVPALLLAIFAARVHDLLGLATLVVCGIGVVVVLLRLRRTVTDCRDLAERAVTVRGQSLIIEGKRHVDLHAGRTTALDPGAMRRFGRAHVLVVDGRSCLLLSDPRTSEPRAVGDLRALIDVLLTSPHERDRDTARIVSQLSTPLSGSDQAPGGKLPVVWRVVDGLAWTVLVFAVVPSVVVAGAFLPTEPAGQSGLTSQALVLIGLMLLGIWAIYVFAHVAQRIGMAWMALTGTRSAPDRR